MAVSATIDVPDDVHATVADVPAETIVRVGVAVMLLQLGAVVCGECAATELAPELEGVHRVEVRDGSWYLNHPIACRLAGLPACPIHIALWDMAVGDLPEPGVWVVELGPAGVLSYQEV